MVVLVSQYPKRHLDQIEQRYMALSMGISSKATCHPRKETKEGKLGDPHMKNPKDNPHNNHRGGS